MTTPADLLKRLQFVVQAGGKASRDPGACNPYDLIADSLSAMAWQYGYDNRVAHFDLLGVAQDINRSEGREYFGKVMNFPRFQPCPSVSKLGFVCEKPLGHHGPHMMRGPEVQHGWDPIRIWTTEQQSVDSGPRIHRCESVSSDGYRCDQLAGHGDDHGSTYTRSGITRCRIWTTEMQRKGSGPEYKQVLHPLLRDEIQNFWTNVPGNWQKLFLNSPDEIREYERSG